MLDTVSDEDAIREVVDRWMSATKEGDTAAVLDLIADDALFMTAAREPFGKEEFRTSFEGMKGMELDGRSDIQEIEVTGEWAWVRNHIDLTVTRPGAERVKRAGYTLTIFRKSADGRWRLFRDANLFA